MNGAAADARELSASLVSSHAKILYRAVHYSKNSDRIVIESPAIPKLWHNGAAGDERSETDTTAIAIKRMGG